MSHDDYQTLRLVLTTLIVCAYGCVAFKAGYRLGLERSEPARPMTRAPTRPRRR